MRQVASWLWTALLLIGELALAYGDSVVSQEWLAIAQDWREQTVAMDLGRSQEHSLLPEELWRYINSSTPVVYSMPSMDVTPEGIARLFASGFVENPFDKRGRSGGKVIGETFAHCASCSDKAYRLVVAGPIGSVLADDFMPEAALGLQVEKQRLWMWCGRNERLTKAHYDPFEGFVHVIRGTKRFSLRAPWEMDESTCAAADKASGGESHCRSSETVVEVGEGDGLYIPAFYYHTVTSQGASTGSGSDCGESLSVTTWFKPAGELQQRLAAARSMNH
jgi:hypothetical protein